MNYPTPHIHATPEDLGKTVLMPGDPLRAKFIAETYLEAPKLVNNIRGIQGYTGTYKGVKLTVMASGMGLPSMGIYSHELNHNFDVDNIIRIGSAGALQGHIALRDLLIVQAASTDSTWAEQFHVSGSFAPVADFGLLECCVAVAREKKATFHVGNVLSSQYFYDHDEDLPESLRAKACWAKMGTLGIEMEAAALYLNAARFGKKALAICTVSDHLIHKEYLETLERQNSFLEMMEVALETACRLEG